MSKNIIKVFIIGILLLFGGTIEAKTSADYTAGYHDGCSSAKGHYTRSRYKYANSSRYHRGWLKGKRACAKKRPVKNTKKRKKVVRHTKSRNNVGVCNTEIPWTAFRRGWDDGLRSAKGRFYVDRRGCAAYRHGWISGYRSCHCGDLKKPDSYAEGYYQGCSSTNDTMIRDDYYYNRSSKYRKGWIQGYRDCRSIYR